MRECLHCGSPGPGQFCCPGCAAVYQALSEAGLSGYYAMREQASGRPVESSDLDPAHWTRDQERYLTKVEAGPLEVRIGVQGMHCAACMWLLEKVLGRLAGVRQARVNLAQGCVTVRFEGLDLGQLVTAIEQVGYRATPLDPAAQQSDRPDVDLLLRLAVAGFGAGNIMMISAALYAGHFQGIEDHYKRFFEHVTMLLATPVVLYSGQLFLRGAAVAWRARHLTMDVPISLGMLATYGYSLWAALSGRGQVYFDTVAMFVFVLLIGRLLETGSRRRVSSTIEHLLAMRPASARLAGGQLVSPDDLRPGDIVVVSGGERVPADGEVIAGRAWVDESLLTGESSPASRGQGDTISGSTRVEDGELTIKVEAVGSDTALAQIASLVRAAQAGATRVGRLIDRAAVVFVGLTLGTAALTFWWWLPHGVERALLVAVSVLIITCPCALGLAVPMAVWRATGRSLGLGVLFRDGQALESAAGLTDLVLDKTGTLTRGEFRIRKVEAVPGVAPDTLLRLAGAAEAGQRHPLARLLAAGEPAEEVEALPGLGVRAIVAGRSVLVGSAALLRQEGLAPALFASGQDTEVWVAREGRVLGCISLGDELRPEASEVVDRLRALGIRLHLVSGDRHGPVRAVAQSLGIESVIWEARPQDKEQFVRLLASEGRRVGVVGDGANDAPALSAAELGVALVQGSAIAASAAPVLLLGQTLRPLAQGLELSRQALATVRENLGISALYNLIAIPVAVAGWVTPLGAALAMPAASLLVVANSMRRF